MAAWVIDCVWSNGIKRQWRPWAGHSGGDGGREDGGTISESWAKGEQERGREGGMGSVRESGRTEKDF